MCRINLPLPLLSIWPFPITSPGTRYAPSMVAGFQKPKEGKHQRANMMKSFFRRILCQVGNFMWGQISTWPKSLPKIKTVEVERQVCYHFTGCSDQTGWRNRGWGRKSRPAWVLSPRILLRGRSSFSCFPRAYRHGDFLRLILKNLLSQTPNTFQCTTGWPLTTVKTSCWLIFGYSVILPRQ